MARKVIMTSVRLEKRLQELKSKGYLLRQEVIRCNKDFYFSDVDKQVFESKGVSEEYLTYPIESVSMYFISETEDMIELRLEADKSGVGRLSSYLLEGNSIPFIESGEKYVLYVGDEVPEEGIEGERLERFELLGSKPFLYQYLSENNMLLDNSVIWSMFNDYEVQDACDWCNKTTLQGIDKIYYDEIVRQLEENNFYFKNSQVVSSNELEVYLNGDGSCTVILAVGSDISLVYSDRYLSVPESLLNLDIDIEKEVDTFVANSRYEIGAMPVLDFSDVLIKDLCSWKYKAVMLNNNVNEALFRFSELDLDSLLSSLQSNEFVLSSLGMVGVRSLVRSVTVCGFENEMGYSYIIFFFSVVEDAFMVKVLSTREELQEVIVNDTIVPLISASTDDFDMVSTLIRGFDFDNFKEYELV